MDLKKTLINLSSKSRVLQKKVSKIKLTGKYNQHIYREINNLISHIQEKEPIELQQLFGLAPPDNISHVLVTKDIKESLWSCCFQTSCTRRKQIIKRDGLVVQGPKPIPLIPITRDQDKDLLVKMNFCRDIVDFEDVTLFACATHFYPPNFKDKSGSKSDICKHWLNNPILPENYVLHGPKHKLECGLTLKGMNRFEAYSQKKRTEPLVELWKDFLGSKVFKSISSSDVTNQTIDSNIE